MEVKSPILNRRCKVFYRTQVVEERSSCRIGIVSGFDSRFLYLESVTAIPICKIWRIEVIS